MKFRGAVSIESSNGNSNVINARDFQSIYKRPENNNNNNKNKNNNYKIVEFHSS